MFHHFDGGVHPKGQGAIDVDEFRRLLDWFGLGRIIPADQWLARFRNGSLSGELCLTFDDNLRCQYDVALPVLDELGLNALWFVYSSPVQGIAERLEVYRYYRTVAFDDVEDFYAEFSKALEAGPHAAEVERALAGLDPDAYLTQYAFYTTGDRWFRYLRDRVLGPERYFATMDAMVEDWDAGKDLLGLLWMAGDAWRDLSDRGHVLGLHSHTHPTDISALPLDAQLDEYRTNQASIAAETGQEATTVAHPASSYTADTLEVLRSLGVDVGFTTIGPPKFDPRMEIDRHDHADLMAQMR